MSNIAHFSINCAPSEFDEILAFYLAALNPLGYKEMLRPVEKAVGLGNGYAPDFWIGAAEGCKKVGREQRRGMGIHFAFLGKDHAAVHAFHTAALKAGGICNGRAGYRPEYYRYYYGAFILDPLGNKVEVVCLSPAWTQLWWWRSWLPGAEGLELEQIKND